MTFWSLSSNPGVALLHESGRACSYQELASEADSLGANLPDSLSRTIGFLLFAPTIAGVTLYLAALRSRKHVPLLLQPTLHRDLLAGLIETYRPEWIAVPAGAYGFPRYEEAFTFDDLTVHLATTPVADSAPHDDLGLLLSTSGSTGSQKLVRLSYAAIDANANSIAKYLGLSHRDRAVTTLPLAYSFGMSLLNSHLAAGGSTLLTEKTLLSRDFWDLVARSDVTSLSGVPNQFEMLRRVGLEKRGLDSLRALTQAGGNLREDIKGHFESLCHEIGAEFFVMYGQTEAAPRISYVPPDRLRDKLGSIGVAIPDGSLEVDSDTGELIYRGPNVMMGYAECREDLVRGDDLGGVLRTGDLGRKDGDGFFYLTGRMKRFIKLAGARVNLDDVESGLSQAFATPLACIGADDRMTVVVADDAPIDDDALLALLRERFDIYAGHVRVNRQPALLYTANGKLDYQSLAQVTAREDC